MYKYLHIYQTPKLSGSIDISGAKNSALPAIAATILAKNEPTLTNVPEVADVKTLLKLLKILGASFEFENNTLKIDTSTINNTTAVYEIVKTMRASILVLGPLLTRFGECKVSLPGGCAIGARPVDLHLKALERMGADITIEGGYIHARGKLTGSDIVFDKVTVTGTENILMAAALAKGKTRIINAAKEPEVVQLCEILQNAGVEIEGIGSDEILITGTDGELLDFKTARIIPDRIEAGTYLCAGAITNSQITIKKANPNHLESILIKLNQMGFATEIDNDEITIKPARKIEPVNISTTEYPGFPTDMQAQFMAIATQAEGVSIIEERLFENRFMHVPELNRLGADIRIQGKIATIYGPKELIGADVMATDLRASSALVLAGLIAEGETKVHRIYHLFRGYEKLLEKFRALGAQMELKEEPNP
ncbi:UDP-N-acetylglucosamine 1-carboxyvinyltransferase [Caminibacter pacificus]|uniref:UDP-N-acetylglucosamine 1-carboxyvinyltransferase n=1 Tax=Caminibacter pacificus TaxID=1424653 RepID=A0AAJ4RE03_9BACT|nr:UDP-N-acetylglucosamine 1-carboxyvinyltransferase [Caminibacter pacificus]QCI28417.1 UDP-N-acetylglucosamine 1-carboxyvinyltransferase [Caminibacter pacificus]ROR40859.1 UDP-N-acetylglucosamine 1-carboxyvinyltransferase [Caminibacter pacificus]